MNVQATTKASLLEIKYRFILLISIGTAILIHLPEISSVLIEHRTHDHYHPRWILLNTPLDVLIGILGSFAITFVLFLFHIQFFRRAKYNFLYVMLAFLICYAFSSLLSDLFLNLQLQLTGSELLIKELHYLHPLQNLAATIIVFLTCRIYFISNQRQQLQLEVQELKTENIQSRYEALKNQVNPHFLFNSLNTLNTLIREDADTAQTYVKQLSTVLRSTLQSMQGDTVMLSEELYEVDSYLYLLKMRYEDNLVIEKNVRPEYLSFRVVPLAIQMLVENAVKHNIISTNKPLLIKIYTTEDQGIVVSNTLQPKLGVQSHTGTGLTNLIRRYQLLSGESIHIKSENRMFTVELPLLEKEEL
ncbi:MAG: histidine kinase [Bacteroidales bacterium]|jgi:sensor histidine kinase YesM|nr:histidine kinase [Bacteroidales bacterium]